MTEQLQDVPQDVPQNSSQDVSWDTSQDVAQDTPPAMTPQDFNRMVIEEFRANGGRVGGMFEGAPLVLLTTSGAKTGKLRTNPAAYTRDGDRILVFASNAGGPVHPSWYFNLLADDRVTVEIGTEEGGVLAYAARAESLRGEERDRLYALQASRDPGFAAYQAGTDRTIPVIALHVLDLAADPARNRAIAEQLVRVHRQLRADLAQLRRGAAAASSGASPAPAPAPAVGEELLRHCLTLCESLSTHHSGENGAFSAFERQFPHLAPVLERLRTEHRAVAASLAKLRQEPPASGEALREELERLATELEDHFAYEEEHLLPALLGR